MSSRKDRKRTEGVLTCSVSGNESFLEWRAQRDCLSVVLKTLILALSSQQSSKSDPLFGHGYEYRKHCAVTMVTVTSEIITQAPVIIRNQQGVFSNNYTYNCNTKLINEATGTNQQSSAV